MTNENAFISDSSEVMWQPMREPTLEPIENNKNNANLIEIPKLERNYLFAIFNNYTLDGVALPLYYVDIVINGFSYYLKCGCEGRSYKYPCKHTEAISIFCAIVWNPPQIVYYNLFEDIYQYKIDLSSYTASRPILSTGSWLYRKICEYIAGDMKKEQTLVMLDNFNKSRKITVESMQNET